MVDLQSKMMFSKPVPYVLGQNIVIRRKASSLCFDVYHYGICHECRFSLDCVREYMRHVYFVYI